ncbi:hypothetical protein TA3x_005622 [Tundrisphaera sp. TA3]|uniref:hypothetical protein n=1 Tax=Tundrisphaera sp. TA3 TaxID=3435775 RepID=UPI003EB926FE
MHDLARRDDGRPLPDDEIGRMMIRQDRWRASRYGLEAMIVDPGTGRPARASDVIRRLVDRLGGVAEELGCARHLEMARAMADGPTGADLQLAVFERTGDLIEVARLLTAGPVPGPGCVGSGADHGSPRHEATAI